MTARRASNILPWILAVSSIAAHQRIMNELCHSPAAPIVGG
jgi:hypothetical protein